MMFMIAGRQRRKKSKLVLQSVERKKCHFHHRLRSKKLIDLIFLRHNYWNFFIYFFLVKSMENFRFGSNNSVRISLLSLRFRLYFPVFLSAVYTNISTDTILYISMISTQFLRFTVFFTRTTGYFQIVYHP